MGNRLSFLIARGVAALVLSASACGGVAPAAVAASPTSPTSTPTPTPTSTPTSTSTSTPTSTSTSTSTPDARALPAVALTTLAGDRIDVTRVAAGRVALVSLWATWCEACQHEMDALNRLDAKTGDDAVVIGVAVGEERAPVAEFARRRGLRYVQLVDPDFAFADAIGQRRIPATLVVDRDGRIVYRGDALDAASLDALKRAVSRPN